MDYDPFHIERCRNCSWPEHQCQCCMMCLRHADLCVCCTECRGNGWFSVGHDSDGNEQAEPCWKCCGSGLDGRVSNEKVDTNNAYADCQQCHEDHE